MKAYLLAAGYGTRLKPLTDTVPKCMVPIKDKPLLGWWFDLFRRYGVSEVLVNTHYLPGPVEQFATEYAETHPELHIRTVFEPVLLGSGGTVWSNRDFVSGEDSFFICYADNLTDIDLSAMAWYHTSHGGVLTMALFHTAHPEQCGIAQVGDDGKIVDFVEKPAHPSGNLANAGIYMAKQDVFSFFAKQQPPIDFGFDVLPLLTGQMYGYPSNCYLKDIGTLQNYEKAQVEWPHDHR